MDNPSRYKVVEVTLVVIFHFFFLRTVLRFVDFRQMNDPRTRPHALPGLDRRIRYSKRQRCRMNVIKTGLLKGGGQNKKAG